MAKRMLLECDACGSTRTVATVSGKRETLPFTVDLCSKCWSAVVADYHLKEGSRSPRKEFIVYEDISDIPH